MQTILKEEEPMENKPDVEVQEQAELDPFSQNAKSSVKITKNSRGISWVIKVVTGEEKLIPGLMDAAIIQHKKIQTQLNIKGEK